MYNVFCVLILASPLILLATYLMLAKQKSFWKIFTIHTIVLVAYMTFVANYSKLLTGHDEYELGQLALGIFLITGHVIIGFAHGLFVTLKRR